MIARPLDEGGAGGLAVGRDEHDALATATVTHVNGGGEMVRPQPGGASVNCRQRHGLAADLGKALEAAADGQKMLVVKGDHVAGVVPAAGWRHDLAGAVGLEIAEHDIRTFDEK